MQAVIHAIAHHGYNLFIFFKALTTASFVSGNIRVKGLYCELPLTFQLHSIS
jgi:hypothetical protein